MCSSSGCCVGRARRRRHARVVAVHVRAQRVRHDAGIQHLARHLEAEMRAMPDVDLEPARQRLLAPSDAPCRRVSTKPPGWRLNGCASTSPGFSSVDDLRQDGVGIDRRAAVGRQGPELAEVDVERQIGLAADLGRRLITSRPQRAKPPSSACALMPLTRSRFSSAALTVAFTSTQSGR